MKKHQASGAVSIQVLSGSVRIGLGNTTVDVAAGQVLALDRGIPHDVAATTDTTVLLSVCFPSRKRVATGGVRAR